MSAPEKVPGARPTVILILDDSASDRAVLRRYLSSDPLRDYEIHERTGLEHAVTAADEVQPDCILLNYSMNDGTGLDFLAELRADHDRRAFAVIMLTRSGSEEVAAAAFRSGALDYLVKGSLTPDGLQRAVRGAIYKVLAERQLEAHRLEVERLFREAQEANSRKDQFLAALSHELRTPLTPILTAVSSVDPRSASVEDLAEIFTTIRRNVELEARLIDDLLDLTRIAEGKLRLDLEPVLAHTVLRHAVEICREELHAKNLRLIVELEAREETIRADSARLQQVFWNLLKNAVKFTPEGGTIHLRTLNLGASLVVEVSDSGCGITADVLPKIFNAFEQGGARMTNRFGGLGLGLAISHALVEAHSGNLRAESPGTGLGSTFLVALPVAPGETAAALGQSPARSRARTLSMPPPGCVILLVEDHPDSARLLARTMQRRGYHVVMADTVAGALAAFTREHVDVVVSDIGLPDGDGVQLMESLRRIRPVPGIALSGYGMERDHSRSHAAGFVAHLTKPVDWPQLDAALLRLLASEHPAEG